MRVERVISSKNRKYLLLKSAFKDLASRLKTILVMNRGQMLSLFKIEKKEFQYEIGLAVIVKNEALYILEWIEYHKLIGVGKFYIFDNDSNDDLDSLLAGYIKNGLVELIKVHGQGKQLEAYNAAIQKSKNSVRWLGVIDADEFIQVMNGKSLSDFLRTYKNVGILIGWMIFGSSGNQHFENRMVIERFTHRANNDFIADYKMIFNPRKALRFVNPHYTQMLGRVVDERRQNIYSYPYISNIEAQPSSKEIIRVNHYYTKSLDEFFEKSNRGYADLPDSQGIRKKRSIHDFTEHDRNEITDESMLKYVSKVRENILSYKHENGM
ncbi:glycosyltransferase family 92 protein [Leuconostoc gasicomitatum]|uniref:Glycosyltransferase family 2 protein n=1 Tax=Leuconostoc gasicomitatum TaxID=115778 RepID=A0ABM9V2M4_9LACO|nr:glycosyltransferase family 92 protein [Leuconostoc gasicomitatum]MBR2276383.1 glycosyltransferase family 92 protein [Leuconostoc sp.]MBZ5954379.1 glycosyltransferase family 92 protein [Leuconostoc gasicomitatum]MBZ5970020.1 glycosyltransferase family 92 protein [Leuconostoc gasicomitatum]MBZ5973538.1 glycosyltransferase family 92 protein [Leuconostoc gasicomitatum]MBZ5997627.1 glycosyltransferase family 92 protein [Leuconostoc gasicomitatum]